MYEEKDLRNIAFHLKYWKEHLALLGAKFVLYKYECEIIAWSFFNVKNIKKDIFLNFKSL